ncbi:MAG: hypothetical protein WC248_03340 [Candidatus Methanomethylophilaceae archaeon]|jgi:hypothetical protein
MRKNMDSNTDTTVNYPDNRTNAQKRADARGIKFFKEFVAEERKRWGKSMFQ